MPFSPKAVRTASREAVQSSTAASAMSTPFGELIERLSLSSTQLKFVFLCLLWYMSSALSNNSAKQILNNFKAPVTLTFVQFAFIAGWCGLLAIVQKLRGRHSRALFGATHGIRPPTREIILTTLPMSFFQIAGHIFGSLATSQIPVSVVHTVKVVLLHWEYLLNIGSITALYSSYLSTGIQCTLFSINVFIIIAVDARRYVSVLFRTFRKPRRSILCAGLHRRICQSEYIYQKAALPRIFRHRRDREL